MRFLNIAAVLCLASLLSCTEEDRSPSPSDYFGQSPPGDLPELFAPDIVSTDASELNLTMTPDGDEIFFSVRVNDVNTIFTVKRSNNGWSKRAIASFSGSYMDVDPFVTADGDRIWFSSTRPVTSGKEAGSSDLWYTERQTDDSWGDPVHASEISHPAQDDYYTSIDQDGTIYFSRFAEHGAPGDLYRAARVDGVFSDPEPLISLNLPDHNEHDPYIARDGSYMIFTSDRPGGFGRGDLWISQADEKGEWTEPRNLGETINTDGYDYCPMVSPDGKYLFFTTNKNGNGDVYWVSLSSIVSVPEGTGD